MNADRHWFFVDPPRPGASVDAFSFGSGGTNARTPDYEAAGQGRRLRMWRPSNPGPNAAIARSRALIVARSRSQSRNNPWAGAALERSTSNGVGTGVVAQMVNGTPQQQDAVGELWERWCCEADATDMLEFEGMQGLAWLEWRESGEAFGRLRPRRASDGLTIPLQVQLMEGEQCPADLFTVASNGNPVRYGIEFNAIGKRVAYWMYREHPGDATMNLNVDATQLVRVPADQVVHLYRPWRIGQQRGVPDHVSALVRQFNLDNLDDAVLERQKIANLFAGFYTKANDPENPQGMVDDMTGDFEPDDDDVPLAGLEPGTMQELPVGVKPEFSEPPAPGSDYSEFLRGNLLAIAARYGVPYEVLTGDLRNVSDRALKLILNEFRRLLEFLQWQFFIPMFLQPIREAVLDAAYLDGKLGMLEDYPTNRAKWTQTLWVPQGWPYSHPVQDVKADTDAVAAGFQAQSEVVLSAGKNPRKTRELIAADNKANDALGLQFTSDGRNATKKAAAPAGPGGGPDAGANQPPPADRSNGEDTDEPT